MTNPTPPSAEAVEAAIKELNQITLKISFWLAASSLSLLWVKIQEL
jgi:hypothetical protein